MPSMLRLEEESRVLQVGCGQPPGRPCHFGSMEMDGPKSQRLQLALEACICSAMQLLWQRDLGCL
jgi:hypothetical protein